MHVVDNSNSLSAFNRRFAVLIGGVVEEDISNDDKWKALKCLMNERLPISVLTERERLVQLKQEPNERLEMFVERIFLESQARGELVSSEDVKRILFAKLPPAARVTCVNLDLECSPLDLMEHLRKVTFWTGLEGERSKPLHTRRQLGGDPMDVDNEYQVGDFGIRDRLLSKGQLDYGEIQTPGAVMVAWKHLLKQKKFLIESKRYLQGAHNFGGSGWDKRQTVRQTGDIQTSSSFPSTISGGRCIFTFWRV